MNDVIKRDIDIWCHPMSHFDSNDYSYFQAKFGRERVKANKVILNQTKLLRFVLLRGVGFRGEKRSEQASVHALSQAQGGLVCVLTVFDCLFVCH